MGFPPIPPTGSYNPPIPPAGSFQPFTNAIATIRPSHQPTITPTSSPNIALTTSVAPSSSQSIGQTFNFRPSYQYESPIEPSPSPLDFGIPAATVPISNSPSISPNIVSTTPINATSPTSSTTSPTNYPILDRVEKVKNIELANICLTFKVSKLRSGSIF